MKISKNITILSISLLVVALSLVFCLKKFFLKPKEILMAKVAIVIDDWGYNLRGVNLLKQIAVPVTISILPNLRYSSKISEIALDLGQEVILHLPLEPESEGRKIGLEKHTITSDMTDDEIRENLKLGLSSVAYACGVSNHMGSRATKDRRVMSCIFSELKKKRLFFLDNMVTDKSICGELARKMKIKFTSRNVFLDNLDDYEYIKGQFAKLAEFALANGYAVGIGHAKRKTLEALKDEIPLIEKMGIKFVFVSDLTE